MRENIRDLSLEEIYNDYQQLKAIEKRYFHCGNNIVFNKAAEALMALLKEEITKRKLEELETNHDLKLTYEEINKLAESKKVTTTTTKDITDYQSYTSTYTQESNNLADMWAYSTTQNNDERLNVNGKKSDVY